MVMVRVALVLVGVSVLLPQSQGAERVDARSLLRHALHRRQLTTSGPLTPYRFKRGDDVIPMADLENVMALGDGATLELVQQTMTVQGARVMKMQERYKGYLLPDGVVTLETDDEGHHVIDASGHVFRNIHLDFEGSSQLGPEQAKALCKHYNHDDGTSAVAVLHETLEKEVLFRDNGEAYPAYLVQYLVVEEDQQEHQPTCLIDASSSSVMVSWDAIDAFCKDCSATGIGGNLNIGKIRYGELQNCLELRRDNGICYLENKYARVLNSNFTMAESYYEGLENIKVASYNCKEIDDYVNGGYSPLLDALFYGTVVGKMFEEWYGMSPLGDIITLRVHWGVNISNARWNGFESLLGDGDGVTYHPLVTIDVVGHEIAHGITQRNSGLWYFNQCGAINEAFSDMTGETAEAYLKEEDWMIGFDMTIGDSPPFRYMDDPGKDNKSISHVDDFTEGLNVHFGSGVYNRVFYILVHDYSLPVKEVYHVFLHANMMYWHHMSNYEQAACDVMKSAYDLGQDGSKFREAFADVGIEVCDVEDHVLGLRTKKVYSNITVSRAISPAFIYSYWMHVRSVTVQSCSSLGDVYIIASDKRWGAGQNRVQVYAEGLHSVTFNVTENLPWNVSITLTTDSEVPLNDVKLVATSEWYHLDEGNDFVLQCEPDGEKDEENDSDDNEEGEEEEEEKSTDKPKKEEKLPSQPHSVFNFFKSFVVIVLPHSK